MAELLAPDELPDLIAEPDFTALPFAERQSLLEQGIAESSKWVAENEGWTPETWKGYGQAVQSLRDEVTQSETLGEKAAWLGSTALGVLKDSAITAGTAVADLVLPPIRPTQDSEGNFSAELRGPGTTVGESILRGGQKLLDTAQTVTARATSDKDNQLTQELTTLRQDIDEGNLPFDDPAKLGEWLSQRSTAIESKQADWWKTAENWSDDDDDTVTAYAAANNLTNPKNTALLATYMRTRDPKVWDAFTAEMTQGPEAAALQNDEDKLARTSALGQYLTTAFGPEGSNYLTEAGDPFEVAGNLLPLLKGAKVVRKGMTLSQRLAEVSKGTVGEVLSEQGSLTVDNPFATWQQREQIAKDTLAGVLGLTGAGAAIGTLTNRIAPTDTPAAVLGTPPQPGPAPTPAAPQPITPLIDLARRAGSQDRVRLTPEEATAGLTDPGTLEGDLLTDTRFRPPPQPTAIQQAQDILGDTGNVGTRAAPASTVGRAKLTILPRDAEGNVDLLNYLNENPIRAPRRGQEGAATAEYDWRESGEFDPTFRSRIMEEGPSNIDQRAQEAYDLGFIPAPTPEALANEVRSVIAKRQQQRKQGPAQSKVLGEMERAQLDFERTQERLATTGQPVNLDDLAPGDTLRIDGQPITVADIEYDEDGYTTRALLRTPTGTVRVTPETNLRADGPDAAEIPLGMMRPFRPDPTMERLSDAEFEARAQAGNRLVDTLERRLDEQPDILDNRDFRQRLAAAQDESAAIELEQLRRRVNRQFTGDVFADALKLAGDLGKPTQAELDSFQGARLAVLIRSIKESGMSDADVREGLSYSEGLMRDPNYREMAGNRAKRLKEWASFLDQNERSTPTRSAPLDLEDLNAQLALAAQANQGFTNTTIVATREDGSTILFAELVDLAARALQTGTRYATWAADLVRQFGVSIKQYLAGAWQAARKTSQVGALDIRQQNTASVSRGGVNPQVDLNAVLPAVESTDSFQSASERPTTREDYNQYAPAQAEKVNKIREELKLVAQQLSEWQTVQRQLEMGGFTMSLPATPAGDFARAWQAANGVPGVDWNGRAINYVSMDRIRQELIPAMNDTMNQMRNQLVKMEANLYLAEEAEGGRSDRLAAKESTAEWARRTRASEFAALLDARDDEAKNASSTFVAKVWEALSQYEESFQFGRSQSQRAEDIADAVSKPGRPVTAIDNGSSVRFSTPTGFLDIFDANTKRPYIRSTEAGSQGKQGGGGAQLYQAALDWIHNNGKRIKDDSGLTDINAIRRTSNFMASALRWGTTSHLKPHAKQKVKWSPTSDTRNIAALAAREMENAFIAVAEARAWRYDFTRNEFIDANGNTIDSAEFDAAVLGGNPSKSGIGVSTLQRAVITSSAIEVFQRGNTEGALSPAEIGREARRGLDGLLYFDPFGLMVAADALTRLSKMARSLAAFTQRALAEFGEWVRPHLQKIWKASMQGTESVRQYLQGAWQAARKTSRQGFLHPGDLPNVITTRLGLQRNAPFRVKQLGARDLLLGSTLPAEMVPLVAKSQNEVKALEQAAAQLARDLQAAETAAVNKRNLPLDVLHAKVTDFLNGVPTAGTVLAAMDPVTYARARRMRNFIDDLTATVAASLPAGTMRDTLVNNTGSWLRRSYAAFDPNSGWNYDNLLRAAKRGQDIGGRPALDVLRKGAAYLSAQNNYPASMRTAQGLPAAGSELETDMRDLMDRNKFELSLTGQPGASKNVTSLMRRKDIPQQIRELMGEETNVYKRFVASASFQAQFIRRHHAQLAMRKVGLASGLLSPTRQGVFTQEIPGDGPEWSGLAGLWTTPELWQALQNSHGVAAAGKDIAGYVGRFLRFTSSKAKLNRVALNPDSWMVNGLGGATMMLMNGDWFSGRVAARLMEAVRLMKSGAAKSGDVVNAAQDTLKDIQRDLIARLTAEGVFGAGITVADIEASLPRHTLQWIETDLMRDRLYGAGEGALIGQGIGRGFGTTARVVGGAVGAAVGGFYGTKKIRTVQNAIADMALTKPDMLFRLTGFLTNYEAALGAGLAPDAAFNEATTRTLNTFPNYAAVPAFLRSLSQFGAINSFVSFMFEMYRNTGWSMRYLAQDLAAPSMAQKRRGLQRLAGAGAVAGLMAGGLPALLALAFGKDDDEPLATDDERNAIFTRWFAAPWERDAILAFSKFDKEGVSYLNTSYLLPQQMLGELAMAARNGDNPADAAARIVIRLQTQFAGDSVNLAPLMQAYTNTDGRGRPVTVRDGIEGAWERADHALKVIAEPGFVDKVNRLAYAHREAARRGRTFSVEQEFRRLIGLREMTRTWDDLTLGRYREFDKQIGRIREGANRTLSENLPGAKATAIERANRELSQIRTDLQRFEREAAKLGVPPGVMFRAKKETGLSLVRNVMVDPMKGNRVKSIGTR